jgi:hypothetical protein
MFAVQVIARTVRRWPRIKRALRRTGVVLVMATASGLIVAVGLAAAGDGGNWSTWRVGDPPARAIALSASDGSLTTARALGWLLAVGIRPTSAGTTRSFDNVRQLTLDETLARDGAGKPLASVSFNVDSNRLRELVRFERGLDLTTVSLARDDVSPASLSYLATLGISAASGAPEVTWDEGMNAWQARWTRQIAGVPAPDDFLAVWIFANGQLRAVVDIASGFAPTPATLLSAQNARDIVQTFLEKAPGEHQIAADAAYLQWVHRNDFVNPALSDAEDPMLSLVFVVPYRISVPTGEEGRGVVWVDAGSGELVGGGSVT